MTAPQAGSAQDGAGQDQVSDSNFRQALEQQISEAIQPVLAEFRQQMAQELAPQESQKPEEGTRATGQDDRQAPSPARTTPPAGKTDHAETPTEVPVKNVAKNTAHGAERQPTAALTAPLGRAVQSVEHLSAQWLQSILVAGLGALLAESTHATVQQSAERGLHGVLQNLFDVVPGGTANKKMQDKTERTLQAILRDALDAVFAENMRASVQQEGQQTIEKSLHGDISGVLQQVRETLQMMAMALLQVLRRHQQTILRLLLAFALLALESSLVQPERAH